MSQVRRGEVRLLHVILVLVALAIVGVPILIFAGLIGGFWFLTKENMDKTIAGAKGYTAAKDPGDAMDKFRTAIHARDYDSASYYCTKDYADMLKKSHGNAKELGKLIDRLREYGKDKGIMSDKLRVALYMLDPFPQNFSGGAAPKEDSDKKKAKGSFKWEPGYSLENPANVVTLGEDKQLDMRMFRTMLMIDPAKPAAAQPITGTVQLVKDGEDWKLDIPVSPAWQVEVSHFNDRCKSYQTALGGIVSDLSRERAYDTKHAYEGAILTKLREVK